MVIKISKRLAVQLAVLVFLILIFIMDIYFKVATWKFVVDGFLIGFSLSSIISWGVIEMGHALIEQQQELIEKMMLDVVKPIGDMLDASANRDLDRLKKIILDAQNKEKEK